MAKQRLMTQVRGKMRLQRMALRTEESYVTWIKRYIFFHGTIHPLELHEVDSPITGMFD